jgi:hypothetical protein
LTSDGLHFYGSVGYPDFGYDSFENGQIAIGQPPDDSAVPGVCSLTGKRPEFTPELTGSFGFDRDSDVTDDFVFDAGPNIEFSSSCFLMGNLNPISSRARMKKSEHYRALATVRDAVARQLSVAI